MKVYAIVNGVEYDLNYGDPAKFEGEDDLGMPDLHRLEERGPMQHGSTDRGYRLDPRYPTYVFGISGRTRAELWDKRTELLSIFGPSRTITMKHVLDNGDVRYLDCVTSGGMKMPAQDRKAGIFQKVGVILKADDPTFYDPTINSIRFQNPYGSDLSPIPMFIPTKIGTGIEMVYLTASVINSGQVNAYPIIRLIGPLEDPVLTNVSTGEKLDFTGTHIEAAHYFDIDLRYGYKTVTDNHGVRQIATLTGDSDLITWHLACASEVAGGVNNISLYADGMVNASNVFVSWFNGYLGI